MSARQLYVLRQEHARSRRSAGGKAAALAQLAPAFPTPDFFVITAAAFDETGVKSPAREQASPELIALGAGPFAVRSSACEEDGAQHAHAGQYATELDVPTEEVFAAAARVWRSGFSGSVAQYRAARGLSAEAKPPAVIVQRMLKPRVAGVAFSACPVTGERDTVVISAVAGRADRLVAGEVDGDAYRISETGAVLVERAHVSRVLSDADCHAVAALARACAAHFDQPQDVEWAFEGDRLYLLQSRPITTLGAAKPTIWDNSNIVESYPGVVSPLTYSFARHVYAHVYRAFARLMGVSRQRVEAHACVFDELLGRIDGRVYYNLLNWYRVLALFPGFKANRSFMEQMMGVGEALPSELAREVAPPARGFWARALDQASLARVGAGLVWRALTLRRTSARFRARLDAGLRTPDAAINAMPAEDLAREYRRIERLLLTRWDAPLINDFLCMIAFGASRRALEVWAGPEGLSLHSDVMIGQGDILSAEPARCIRTMGELSRTIPGVPQRLAAGDVSAVREDRELAAAFDAYIARFGDRCVNELKLESRSLHEDPSPLLLAIAASAHARERQERTTQSDAGARLANMMRGKPFQRVFVRWLLRWAKARVRDRENLRFERTRLFGRARRLFNALGVRFAEAGMLAHPSDVFYLTVEEALAAAERGGFTDLRRLAATRREEDEASSKRPDPPERIATGAALSVSTSQRRHDSQNQRWGLACCAGVVTARVRVIADPRVETLEPGEILVARSTDPGWIAAFVNAAGIITERGSLLSHSAIVAREMGVPCIVGLKGATEWLNTGDLVRLDGGAGAVERVTS